MTCSAAVMGSRAPFVETATVSVEPAEKDDSGISFEVYVASVLISQNGRKENKKRIVDTQRNRLLV
jgi:hypothetical protein